MKFILARFDPVKKYEWVPGNKRLVGIKKKETFFIPGTDLAGNP